MKPEQKQYSKMLAETLLEKAHNATATAEQLQVLRARIDANDSPNPFLTSDAAKVAEALGLSKEWGWLREARFTFVDLFAGIGGMRLAAESEGGRCVASVEINPQCIETYKQNFADDPTGDITILDPASLKEHHLLLAGFPCQAFSIAGRKGGFEDTRGTLFRNVAEIIAAKRPDAFILENVKGLVSHAKRQTLPVILNTLQGEPVNYYLVPQSEKTKLKGTGWAVLNALDYGVPQNRERIFIVGFKDPVVAERFRFPEPSTPGGAGMTLQDVLEDGPRWQTPVHARHFISDKYLQGLKRHRAHHESIGQGFGFEERDHGGFANALVGGGMGRERNLVKAQMDAQGGTLDELRSPRNNENLRRMTPREWARLQGFPEWFQPHRAETHAYKQFGNSVAVPNVAAVIRAVRVAIENTDSHASDPSSGPTQLHLDLLQANDRTRPR
jgi:DNA (cytosine-5)-methyltransferase 1